MGAQAQGEELRELGEGEWEGVHSEDSRGMSGTGEGRRDGSGRVSGG